MVAHFVAVLFPGYIAFMSSAGSSLFSWHPTLMSIAFTLLLFEGILTYSPQSSLFSRVSPQGKIQIHALFMVSALVCALLGFSAIFFHKLQQGWPHFTSWHGLIGILTISYVGLQCVGGICLKTPEIQRRLNMRRADLKLYHVTSALALLLLVCISLVLGMWSSWFSSTVTGTSWYACLACVSCMGMIVMNQITSQYMPRSKAKKA